MEVATGQVFTGNEAVRLKLVDGAVYLDEFAEKMKKDLNKEKLIYLRYKRPAGLFEQIFLGRRASAALEIAELFGPLNRLFLPSGLYYLMER